MDNAKMYIALSLHGAFFSSISLKAIRIEVLSWYMVAHTSHPSAISDDILATSKASSHVRLFSAL